MTSQGPTCPFLLIVALRNLFLCLTLGFRFSFLRFGVRPLFFAISNVMPRFSVSSVNTHWVLHCIIQNEGTFPFWRNTLYHLSCYTIVWKLAHNTHLENSLLAIFATSLLIRVKDLYKVICSGGLVHRDLINEPTTTTYKLQFFTEL